MNTNKTNALYQVLDTPDRSRTQLAFAANYLPRSEICEAAAKLIVWSRRVMLYKGQVDTALNSEMTTITYAPSANKVQQWNIHWKYNAIPTQIEWERKSASFIIECEFRVIADGTKIVLFSF